MTRFRRSSWLALVLAAVLLLSSTVMAQDWTPDTAKQLLEPGWEYIEDELQKPAVVMYRAAFQQVSSSYMPEVLTSWGIDRDPNQTVDEWSVTTKGGVLQAARQAEYSLSMEGRFEEWLDVLYENSALLVTVDQQPVSVQFRYDVVGSEDDDWGFLLRLRPTWLEPGLNSILTSIDMEYQSPYTQAGDIGLEAWVTRKPTPVAVITKQQEHEQSRVTDTFRTTDTYILYIWGESLPADQLPSEYSMAAMGTVKGLDLFMPVMRPEMTRDPSRVKMGMLWDGDDFGVHARLDVTAMQTLAFSVDVRSDAVFLGFSERREPQPGTVVHASFYPLKIDLDPMGIGRTLRFEAGVDVAVNDRLGVLVDMEYDERLAFYVGARYDVAPRVTVEAKWLTPIGGTSGFYAGMSFLW